MILLLLLAVSVGDLQQRADSFLPLYDGMQSHKVIVLPDGDVANLCQSVDALACASSTGMIYVKQSTVDNSTEEQLDNILKHELIHEWAFWKGLDTKEHGEVFKRKATEIGLNDRRYNTVLAAQPEHHKLPEPDVSADDLKILWGKILSGEFNSPGTFSLRTLDILKNMTSHEAHIFHSFSKATVKTSYGTYKFCVLINDDLHRYLIKRFWLAYDDISFLKEIGLVRSELNDHYFHYQEGRLNYLSFEKGKFQLAVKLLEGKQGTSLRVEVLTKSGIELLSLIEQEDDLELLEEIKKVFEGNAEVRITDEETRHREMIKKAIEINKAKNQDFFLVAVGGDTTVKTYAEYYKVPVEVLAEFNELPIDTKLTVDTIKIPSYLFDEEGNVK
jgi:hypothetical protein